MGGFGAGAGGAGAIPGMGFSTVLGQGGNAPTSAPALVGGAVSVAGSVGGGSGGNGGVLALILIVGGLAVLYMTTRTIQGSR